MCDHTCYQPDSVLPLCCRNAQGFQKGDFPWRWSFCAWSLAPPSPETLVIEDATQDARCVSSHVQIRAPSRCCQL